MIKNKQNQTIMSSYRNIFTVVNEIIKEEPFIEKYLKSTIEYTRWLSGKETSVYLPSDVQDMCWSRVQDDLERCGMFQIWENNPERKSLKVWMKSIEIWKNTPLRRGSSRTNRYTGTYPA